MGYLLFFIPAVIFGVLAGTNSLWWLLVFCIWEFTLGHRYAEWVNGDRLGSAGIGVLILDVVAVFAACLTSFILLPSFSWLQLLH